MTAPNSVEIAFLTIERPKLRTGINILLKRL
jgi:hypothetical protein